MKPIFPPASEGSMRAVRVSFVHVSAASRLGGPHFLRQLVCIGDVLGELGQITEEKFGRSDDRATDNHSPCAILFSLLAALRGLLHGDIVSPER